jgi:amidase/aspartyl-tRNA(Asn)/glutamyl-tRNA(Gln) amidotransferase subunit A
VTLDFGIFPVDPRIRRRITECAARLQDAGVTVVEIKPRLTLSQQQLSDLWCRQIMISNVATLMNFMDNGMDLLAENQGSLPETYVRWVEHAREMKLPEVIRDYEQRSQLIDAFGSVFREVDILLSPTVASLPVMNSPEAGMTFGPNTLEGEPVDASIGWCMTYFTNFTGHPAASVPVGLVDGLPVGMQVMGSRYGDEDVLRFAAAFEARWPWQGMYDICASRELA